jgi:hypothetical protein
VLCGANKTAADALITCLCGKCDAECTNILPDCSSALQQHAYDQTCVDCLNLQIGVGGPCHTTGIACSTH